MNRVTKVYMGQPSHQKTVMNPKTTGGEYSSTYRYPMMQRIERAILWKILEGTRSEPQNIRP